jgi:hypothetical protein
VNIFFRELRANIKSLLIWAGIVILFNLVGVMKFSAYYNNPELLAIVDSFPPAMVSALSLNAFNLTTVTGFYGIMIVYFALILTIAAVMWGSDIIAKEERGKTGNCKNGCGPGKLYHPVACHLGNHPGQRSTIQAGQRILQICGHFHTSLPAHAGDLHGDRYFPGMRDETA